MKFITSRQIIFRWLLLAALAFGACAGFVHNHTDDLFHATDSHETCPVQILGHLPLEIGPCIVKLCVTLILLYAVILLLEYKFFRFQSSVSFPRAPPLFS